MAALTLVAVPAALAVLAAWYAATVLSGPPPPQVAPDRWLSGTAAAASALVLVWLSAALAAGAIQGLGRSRLSCGSDASGGASGGGRGPGAAVAALACALVVTVGGPASALPSGPDATVVGSAGPVTDPGVVAGWTPVVQESPPAATRPAPAATRPTPARIDRRAVSPDPSPGASPGVPQDVHVVVPGDTLWGIAAARLGPEATVTRTAAEWPGWWRVNRDVIGEDPDLLVPGQRLLPPP
jgi:LysM repeat protein